MARDFIQLLRKHSLDLRNLEDDEADNFLDLLKRLRLEVQDRLGNAGVDETMSVWNLRRVLGETEVGIKTLQAQAKQQFVNGKAKAVDKAISHFGTELNALAKKAGAKPMPLTMDAQRVFADPNQELLATQFQRSIDRYGLKLLNQVDQRIRLGMMAGDTVSKIARDITGEKGIMGEVSKPEATRLVRTEISNVYNTAHQRSLFEMNRGKPPKEKFRKVWIHAGQYKCDRCIKLNGTSREADGFWLVKESKLKPARKVYHPPEHPHCVCRIVPMKPGWEKALAGLDKLYAAKSGKKGIGTFFK
jgi:hypothetical protein